MRRNTPRCATDSLKLEFVSFTAGLGHKYIDLALRNTGARCTLTGYPKVQMLDDHRDPRHANIENENTDIQTVVLDPGQRAYLTFTYLWRRVLPKSRHGVRSSYRAAPQLTRPRDLPSAERVRDGDQPDCWGDYPIRPVVRPLEIPTMTTRAAQHYSLT
ncbi:MAG: DUF4232 domain-containing protein [Solirubrobacteraceae bacterium]